MGFGTPGVPVPAFGPPNAAAGGAFQQPFGSGAPSPFLPAPTQPGLFPTPPRPVVHGQAMQQASPFASPPQAQAQAPFPPMGAQASTPFGQPASPFGQPASVFGQPAPAFGQPGTPPLSGTPAFGANATPPAFGQSVHTFGSAPGGSGTVFGQTPFGAAPTAGISSSPFGQAATGGGAAGTTEAMPGFSTAPSAGGGDSGNIWMRPMWKLGEVRMVSSCPGTSRICSLLARLGQERT